jgi:hypothetical protein
MTLRKCCLSAAVLLLCGFSLWAADPARKTVQDLAAFGTFQSPSPKEAREQALDWYKSAGKTDMKAFDAIWDSDRTVFEKVTETLILGDDNARQLMADVRDPKQPAPTTTPAILKDTKVASYLRSNLALAYARELSNRRIFDECLEAMKLIKPDKVVDPATFFFHKAVTEHTLMLRKEADDSIGRLLDDVTDAPERYRRVAELMHFDMRTWQDNDLGWISRKMGVIRDRLDLTRGGKKTQQMQKEVLVRLDEMIKEMENKQKQQGQGQGSNGGNCPPGSPSQGNGPPQGNTPNGPATESGLPSAPPGQGNVKVKEAENLAKIWGTLPEKERVQAMRELTRDMPAKYRETIETYLKKVAERSAETPNK